MGYSNEPELILPTEVDTINDPGTEAASEEGGGEDAITQVESFGSGVDTTPPPSETSGTPLSPKTTIYEDVNISPAGAVRGGKQGFADGAPGFWMGQDGGVYKFVIQGLSGEKVEFNGTTFSLPTTEVDSLHIPDQNTTADSFHVDTTGNTWWAATNTNFTANNKNAKAYVLKSGDAYFQNVEVNGTMKTVVFEKDVVSAVGGQLQVSNADALATDMTALDAATLTIKGETTFAVNDILHIKDGTDEEYLRVTAIGSAPTYSVTRDLAAAYASNSNPAWKEGVAVVVEGLSDGASTFSGGFLRLLGSGTNSPKYSVFKRTGAAYNAITEYIALGNINGMLDYVAEQFGIAIGTTSDGYLSYDPTNGLRVFGNLQTVISLTAGEAISANDFVRIGTDGKAYKASAIRSTVASQTIGVAPAAVSKDSVGFFQILGDATQSGLSAGTIYYITDGTIDETNTSADTEESVFDTNPVFGQTFTTSVGVTKLDAISLFGRITGSGCGNITINVYATAAGVPTGGAIGTSEVRATSGFSTSNEWQTWVFATPVVLTASTLYAFTLTASDGDGSNTYVWRENSTSSYSSGTALQDGATVTRDFVFRTVFYTGAVSSSVGTTSKEAGIARSATKLIMRV